MPDLSAFLFRKFADNSRCECGHRSPDSCGIFCRVCRKSTRFEKRDLERCAAEGIFLGLLSGGRMFNTPQSSRTQKKQKKQKAAYYISYKEKQGFYLAVSKLWRWHTAMTGSICVAKAFFLFNGEKNQMLQGNY